MKQSTRVMVALAVRVIPLTCVLLLSLVTD